MIEPIGGTAVEPETVFFWDTDLQATVEVTVLEPESGEDRFLIRTTKTYRLLKQDPDGRQNWQRNLVKLNEYLREAFSSFRISAATSIRWTVQSQVSPITWMFWVRKPANSSLSASS